MTDEVAILRYISDSGGERRAKEPPDVIAKRLDTAQLNHRTLRH